MPEQHERCDNQINTPNKRQKIDDVDVACLYHSPDQQTAEYEFEYLPHDLLITGPFFCVNRRSLF